MSTNHLRTGVLAVAATLVVALAAMPDALEAQRPEALASAAVYSAGVDFRPYVAYDRAILTLSGNDRVYRYEFEAGRYPSLGIYDPEGQQLPDGAYSWELEFVPDEASANELRQAASGEDGSPAVAWETLSGAFTLEGGLIASPDLAEAAPGRVAGAASGGGPARGASSRSGAGVSRASVHDTDDLTGNQDDYEQRIAASAAIAAPAAASGSALVQPDRAALEDSDAATAARGQSLESPRSVAQGSSPTQLQAAAPRPRSDGTNGRPRSDDQ